MNRPSNRPPRRAWYRPSVVLLPLIALTALFAPTVLPPLAPAPAAAQEPPPTFPELTRWVSEDDDISAPFVNPAGLARNRGTEGYLELNFERGDHTQGIAMVGVPFLKAAYVHDSVGRRDYDTYAL